MNEIQLRPDQASSIASRIDTLFYVLIAMSLFFIILVMSLVIFFSIRYRRGSKAKRDIKPTPTIYLELTWTIIPLFLAMGIFVWSAYVFFDYMRVPQGALEIFVTGKQWMWKIQHQNGRREINELHVPNGTPVKLTMTSEDVIHSFYVPAFRVKKDVLPGKYTTLWFEPTAEGIYHLFCAEYCGTEHSGMVGRVVVMPPEEYEAWLETGNTAAPPVTEGERLFAKLACVTCHNQSSGSRGPHLAGLFGSEVELATGEKVMADNEYIRESILNPQAKIVAGYPPLMPTYQKQVQEEDMLQIIAYIRSLEAPESRDSS